MSKKLVVKPGVIQFLHSHGPLASVEEIKTTLSKYAKDYSEAKSDYERDIILRCAREVSIGYASHPENTKENIDKIIQFCDDCFDSME